MTKTLGTICSIMLVVSCFGCNNSSRTKNIFSCTVEESAHMELMREVGAEVIEPGDLVLLGSSSLGTEIFELDMGSSVEIGLDSPEVAALHLSTGAVGELRTLGKDEQFTIEVIADLSELVWHNDLIDNGQIELDIRPEGDGARIKFLRKTSYGWEEVKSQVLPLSMFLGPHTFAGRYSNARMEVFIDGVLVADKYSPKRTRSYAHDLEVGQTGIIGRIGRISLGPASMDLAASFDALTFGDEFVRGDANQDGSIDKFDIVHIRDTVRFGNIMCGCEEAYDVNDDGLVDLMDIVAITDMVNLGDSAPYPFPMSDRDFDGDDLTCFQHNAF